MMHAETILRPSPDAAAPAVQLLRRRAFGKLVRVDLAQPDTRRASDAQPSPLPAQGAPTR